jgi:hypothetical protein
LKLEGLTDEKNKVIEKITECLANAGVDINGLGSNLEKVLEKLEETLLNYFEDVR